MVVKLLKFKLEVTRGGGHAGLSGEGGNISPDAGSVTHLYFAGPPSLNLCLCFSGDRDCTTKSPLDLLVLLETLERDKAY